MRKLSSTRIRYLFFAAFVFFALVGTTFAGQPFNKTEFVAQWDKLFEKIPDGMAVLFAAKRQHYPVKFRQAPDFYYLTGIEEAGAILVMMGPSKRTFLFAPRRSEPMIRAEGPGIWQLEKREEVYGLTRVQPIEEFLSMLSFLPPGVKKLYMLTGSQGNVQNARKELDYYIGISTHDVDPPDRNRPFVAGVVFNVEPLIEVTGKIHLRLEDTVLVTPTGSLNMTAGVPAGLEEIYALVRQKALTVNP